MKDNGAKFFYCVLFSATVAVILWVGYGLMIDYGVCPHFNNDKAPPGCEDNDDKCCHDH